MLKQSTQMAIVRADLYMTVYTYVITVNTDGGCDGGIIYDNTVIVIQSTQMATVRADLYMTVYTYVKTVDTDGHCDGGFIYDRIQVC